MRLLRYIVVIMLPLSGFAQQLPQYSQYMLNELVVNPAVSGRHDFAEVRSNSRLQWVGITDAPRTYILTVHGPLEKKHMGLGMTLFTDVTGPTRRTGLNFSYAYHVKVKEDMFLSMGLSAGILQWGIDGSKISLKEEGDLQLLTRYQTVYLPDFSAGVYFYKKNRFYFGVSLPQINQSQIPLYPGAYKNSRLATQFNINGAYTFDIGEDFKAEPSFLFKFENPAPLKTDVGARIIYKDQVWLGGVYRYNDAFSALLGYVYEDYLMIGYSYDFTTTMLKTYSSGTHELMLGLKFTRKQAPTWEKVKE
jgi:type IX secretion system PorP/SprF family membrane protein